MSEQPGSGHFVRQRVTAVLLVPLVAWFVFTVARFTSADHATVLAFLQSPVNGLMMIGLIVAGLYHLMVGLEVVIEDYIGQESTRNALLFLNRLFCYLISLAATLAVGKILGWIAL